MKRTFLKGVFCSAVVAVMLLLVLGILNERASAIPDDSYEPDDDHTTANQLLFDVPQTHNISKLGSDVDWVYFTITFPRSIRLETSGPSGDTRLYLYNSSGVPSTYIAYNDDSGVGLFSRITMYSLPPDTYYARVSEYGSNNEISEYQISLTQFGVLDDIYEPDDVYTQASEILSEVPQNHNINDGGSDVDWVRFNLQVTSNVTIETSGTSGDTIIYLYNSTGVPSTYITYNDDSGPGAFSRIVRSNLPAGTYYIRIREYGSNNEIANYTVSLDVTPVYPQSLAPGLDILLIVGILAIIVVVVVIATVAVYMSWKKGRQQVQQPYTPMYPGMTQSPPGATAPVPPAQPPVYQPMAQQPPPTQKPVFCLRCGKPIEATWSTCIYCGNRLKP